MSGCSSDGECPNCHKDMYCYTDYKPFDNVTGECLNCGFNYFTDTYFDDFGNLNERRKDFGLKPITKKQYNKIKRNSAFGKCK